VWSLGLLAFFLLTGRVFWMTPTYANANVAALLGELLMLPLPSASARAAGLGVDGRIPPGFDEWFARCLSRDASARFADASAAVPPLVALLQRTTSALPPTRPDVHVPPTLAMPMTTLAGPATAGPPAPVAPPAVPVRSRRASVAVVGVAALLTVALAVAGVSLFQHVQVDRHPVVVATPPTAPRPVVVSPPPAPVAHPVAAPPVIAAAPPPVEAPSRSRRSSERAAPVFVLPSLAPPSPDDRDRRRRRRERRNGDPRSPFGVFHQLR
jgi:hypothetical protein